jgi:hypothetical protein
MRVADRPNMNVPKAFGIDRSVVSMGNALIRASSESRIQQISKSREVHDKNCNGDPC